MNESFINISRTCVKSQSDPGLELIEGLGRRPWKSESAVENGGKSCNKKMQYFTICDEKNPGYRIIELICYCFLTNLGI